MSDMSRKETIENLETLKAFLEVNGVFTVSDAIKNSIDFAISSLETDEAYQLEYEHRELCEDCISRNAVMDMIIEYRDSLADIGMKYALERAYGVNYVGMKIADMPSVLSKADKPTIIDWNNCHTPEQLDSIATTKNDLTDQCIACKYDETEDEHGEHCKKCLEGDSQFGLDEALANPTTKNDLGVDAVSRQAVLDIAKASKSNWIDNSILFKRVNELPSVTPQEPKTGHWNEIPKYKDIAWRCSECEHFTTMKHNYCPNCGCRMVEPQESGDKE